MDDADFGDVEAAILLQVWVTDYKALVWNYSVERAYQLFLQSITNQNTFFSPRYKAVPISEGPL